MPRYWDDPSGREESEIFDDEQCRWRKMTLEEHAARQGVKIADMNLITTFRLDERPFRELRLWHWRQFYRHQNVQFSKKASEFTRAEARKQANFHMQAVQTLNDLFALGDTAQHDIDTAAGL